MKIALVVLLLFPAFAWADPTDRLHHQTFPSATFAIGCCAAGIFTCSGTLCAAAVGAE